MGDKAILAEVLEASHLTGTYQRLTPNNVFKEIKEGRRPLADQSSTVRYHNFHDSDNPGPLSTINQSNQAYAQVQFGRFTDNERPSASDSEDDSDQQLKQLKYSDTDETDADSENELLLFTLSNRDTFTVDQAVDALGFGKFQLKLSILTGIAWMADAMEMMILAILSPALHCDWLLPPWKQAFITTVVFCGMMLSSTLWGNICDKYGRRSGLILCAALTFYFGFLSAFSPNFVWLLILRGLTGFGIGGVPQSVTLYAEFLPSTHRATCVVLIESFWAIGACLEVLLAYVVMETFGWRWLLALSSLPCLIFSLCCFWLPESARYHVACGQSDLAYATLQRIADENGKPMLLGKLVDASEAESSKRGRLIDLFTDDHKVTTILLWFIWMANAFCYYGLVIFTTQLFESGDQCHGGLPAQSHTSITGQAATKLSCALECHRLQKSDYSDLLLTTLAEFPGLLLTALVIEWLGRRVTMGAGFIIYSVFTFLLFICMSRNVMTGFLFAARAAISGAFQAVYVYTPEVYPTTTRAIGLGSCSGMARIGAIFTPFVAQVAAQRSVNIPVAIYGCTAILGAIASFILPIETKGRELKVFLLIGCIFN